MKVKISDKNLKNFVKNTADLLSKFNTDTYVDFASELSFNIIKIMLYCKEVENIQYVSRELKFEELKERGQPKGIRGIQDV